MDSELKKCPNCGVQAMPNNEAIIKYCKEYEAKFNI